MEQIASLHPVVQVVVIIMAGLAIIALILKM